MAFKSIASYVDQIEVGFANKESPAAIAKRLGIPGKSKTIARYKAAVWDLKDLVADAKEVRAEKHESQRNQAVDEIGSTLEVINLGKLRAKELLSVSLGDEFEVFDGETHRLTLGSASIYWPSGAKMLSECARLELELSGDDTESRKASAIESLSEAELDARLRRAPQTKENHHVQGGRRLDLQALLRRQCYLQGAGRLLQQGPLSLRVQDRGREEQGPQAPGAARLRGGAARLRGGAGGGPQGLRCQAAQVQQILPGAEELRGHDRDPGIAHLPDEGSGRGGGGREEPE